MTKCTIRKFRAFRKATRQHRWLRAFRPVVETLETRLTPSNVPVTMFHYNPQITGQDLQETTLSPVGPTPVNATDFGKLADAAVDGYVYAQPLYVPNLMIGGAPHNVAFVATEHDSLYALDVVRDASVPTGLKLTPLWQRSFINPAMGITTVPSADVGSTDIVPEVGITGAPAIDPATNVLYLVTKTKEVRADGNHYVQKLYAIDIASPTGADKVAPYTIGDSKGDGYNNQNTAIQVAGNGADGGGGMVPFNAFRENQRPSLLILDGRVYVGWASHGDNLPYHGWVVGFKETTLEPEKLFNITPNARGGGIWQSGGALSTDGTYIYFGEGNGFNGPFPAFDPTHGNYSESVIKLDPTAAGTNMPVADYFTPYNYQQLDNIDADLGSGGVMLLPDSVGSTAHPHLMVETGKDGHIYLLDRDNLGQFDFFTNNIVQEVVAGPGGVWGNPAFYQESATSGLIFYHGASADARAFRITNGQIQQVSANNYIAYRSSQNFGFPGAQPVITGNGMINTTAIDWELQSDNYGSQGPEVLHAYAARPAADTGTMTELYNSNQAGQRDQLGGSVKFTSAIVSNGWVLVGQEYHFSLFGLFPTHTDAPAMPSNLTGTAISTTSIQLTWANPSPNTATGIKILRSTDGTNFTQITTVPANATTYTDTGLMRGATYYYRVVATNQAGDSPPSDTAEVNLSPVATFIMTGFPSPTTAGDVGIFTVTAVDANGNVIPNYTGTVSFYSSDPQATLPEDYTFTAADMGTHSFAAILATAGTQSITATDVASGVSGTQDNIAVNPGALAAFVVQGFPSPIQAGTPGSFTVTAYDAYGNLVTDYTGTVSFYSSDPQASLPADYTFTPDDMGMHTFTATLYTAGTQSIGAYDTTTGAAGQQDGIQVTPSTAVGFLVNIPSPVTAGDFVFFTVTAVDAYGNPNALYTGTVTFSSSDPDANLPDDYTFTPEDNGAHTFAVVFNTPGMQSLTVMDVNDPTINGTQTVEVNPAGSPSAGGGHKGTAYPAYLTVGGTETPVVATPPVRYVEAGTPAAPERGHPSVGPAAESVAAASAAATPPDYQALDRLFADDGATMLSESGLNDPLQTGFNSAANRPGN
jgi:hypothetical protein